MLSETYILCGPDGSGKSTIASGLAKLGWDLQYGGKKKNHMLYLMRINFSIYLFIKDRGNKHITLLYLYLIFYPIEFFEYLAKLRYSKSMIRKGINVVFDRFFPDRMWRKYIKTKFPINVFIYFYYYLYYYCFPKRENFIFVLPNARIIYKRRPNDYESLKDCEKIIAAYRKLYEIFKNKKINVLLIEEQNITWNIERIINWKNNVEEKA